MIRPSRGSVQSPRSLSAWVECKYEEREGRYVISEARVLVHPSASLPPKGITTEVWKRIGLGKALATMRSQLGQAPAWLRPRIDALPRNHPSRPRLELLYSKWQARAGLATQRGRRPVPQSKNDLKLFSYAKRFLEVASASSTPTLDLADEWGISPGAANKCFGRTRKAGFLAPGEKARVTVSRHNAAATEPPGNALP